ncbi:MAG TPA: alpha/beta fold hydrolase [Solirubrobacteraceae bacterium]|jgi:pimeloyl-ACP methyl ester carboxylesterase|nr:alpha/beta fold hydrolase [Solirubrobacteraceae bacterium]
MTRAAIVAGVLAAALATLASPSARAALDSPHAVAASSSAARPGAPPQPPVASGSRLAPCRQKPGFDCTTVSVPLDRTGAVPGGVALAVAVERTRTPARGTALLLAGGPGQAALPLVSDQAALLGPTLHGYRLITFDQRGTGESGAIDCPALQRISQAALSVPTPAALDSCGAQLGATRGLYSTGASVDDIEAVRQSLGVPRLALIGVSYGTYVAERYARKYPQNVDRLLLDSVVPQEGPDPLLLSTFARIPAMLGLLCARGACSQFLHDPGNAFADVVSVLRRRPITGQVGALGGRRRTVTLHDREGLLDLLVSASQQPELLSRIPAALASAVRGDYATLLRLYDLSRGGGAPVSAKALSAGLNAATLCDDARMPWGGPDAPLDARAPALAQAGAALPPSVLFPFGPDVATGNGLVQTCLRWPVTSAAPPPAPGPLPDVPTLLLSGDRDLSTPVSDAAREASRSPHGVLIVVGGQGHAILGSPPPCVLTAVSRLFAGAAIGSPCKGAAPPFATAAQDPHSVRRVAPAPPLRGLSGRVLRAALGAISDAVFITQVVLQVSNKPQLAQLTYGGLRGGRFQVKATPGGGLRLTFKRDTYVPGVPVTGHIKLDSNLSLLPGRLVVAGQTRGFMVIHGNGRVDGRLAGRGVHVRLTVD